MQLSSSSMLVRAWNRTPLHRRVAILMKSVLEHEHSQLAVSKLICAATVMAMHLENAQSRSEIAALLRSEAEDLDPVERRALH